MAQEERLHHPLLEQLIQTFTESLELRGAGTVNPRKAFRLLQTLLETYEDEPGSPSTFLGMPRTLG